MDTHLKYCSLAPDRMWLFCLELRSSQEKALIPRLGFLTVKELSINLNMPYSDSEKQGGVICPDYL